MWQRCEKDGIVYYFLPHWAEQGAEVYLSTRIGNISKPPYDGLNMALHVGDDPKDVLTSRRRWMDALSIPHGDFVTIQQTHSNHIRQVTAVDRGRGAQDFTDAFAETDGIFTDEPYLFMATFYADCLPLAIFDPNHQGLGLAHAGWKGTFQNIGGLLLKRMGESFGTRPEEALFAMGAGIMSCCYEVDKSFRERFLQQYPDMAEHWFTPGKAPGKYQFDNIKANRDLALVAGILEEHLDSLDRCTCCHSEDFYSYRGSGGHCGRHGLFGRLCLC